MDVVFGRYVWILVPLIRELEKKNKWHLAIEAGFDCVEPFDRELEKFEREGGNLTDIKKLDNDSGLYIPSVLGLWNVINVSEEKIEAKIEEQCNCLCTV